MMSSLGQMRNALVISRFAENDLPLLEDLYNALRAQDEKEAQYIATAFEIYVTGSLNVFNHHTNVDVNSRIVCYDIKELGKQLKKIGMLVVQDQVWNRVTINRAAHKTTRYYPTTSRSRCAIASRASLKPMRRC